MALNQEIKERIFAAADELHAASPNGELGSFAGGGGILR